MPFENVVIGTGLSALAVTKALLKRKRRVHVVDVGHKLPRISDISVNLASIHTAGIKTYYGYKDVTESKEEEYRKAGFAANTHVYGGLSNIWGASLTLLSRTHSDHHRETCFNMSPYVEEVFEWMPMRESRHINVNTNLHDAYLVAARHAIHKNLCRMSQRCLYGCPNSAIFNAADEFDKLLMSNEITLTTNFKVDKISELEGVVNLYSGDRVIITKKCFVCAGASNTAKIMMCSSDKLFSTIIHDSQYFIVPVIWPKYLLEYIEETYSPSFANLTYKVGSHELHAQLYGMSRYLDNHIKYNNPLAYKVIGICAGLKSRLGMVQSYLPSSQSGSIVISKQSGDKFSINEYQKYSSEFMLKTRRRLGEVLSGIGAKPIFSKMHIPNVMEGYHFGCCFPMGQSGAKNETDTVGRLGGFENVHICDSSVLIEIPSSSPTLEVMANGVRIVSEVYK